MVEDRAIGSFNRSLYPIYSVVRLAQVCSRDRAMQPPAMDVGQLEDFLRREFPQGYHSQSGLTIEEVRYCGARVRQAHSERFLRPGGTISGPTMMALADFTLYAAVLATIGPVPLAVTTNFNINFLRKPAARDLIADCRLLKVGKRLAVGEVALLSMAAKTWSPMSRRPIQFQAGSEVS